MSDVEDPCLKANRLRNEEIEAARSLPKADREEEVFAANRRWRRRIEAAGYLTR